MAIASAGEPFDLEARHTEDGAWRPCRASLSLGIVQSFLNLEFESCDEKTRISSRENVLSCLRFRSISIRDGNCSHIVEGENVLAMDTDHTGGLYFDAVIEKTHRLRHSNRILCRCTFEIKWLTSKLKGLKMTVPSHSIMRLSDKHINIHPIVAAFLESLKPLDSTKGPSLIRILEEAECETNPDGQLDKQVEELSKLAEGYCFSKNVLLGGESASASSLYKPHKPELPLFKPEGQLELLMNDANKHQNGRLLDIQHTMAGSDDPAVTIIIKLSDHAQEPNSDSLVEAREKNSVVTGMQVVENSGHEDSQGCRASQEEPTVLRKEAESIKLDAAVKENSANLRINKKLDGHRISARITRSSAKKQNLSMATGNDGKPSTDELTCHISTKSECTGQQSTREKPDMEHIYREDRKKKRKLDISVKKATRKSRTNFASNEGSAQVTGKRKKTTDESSIHLNEDQGMSSGNAKSIPAKKKTAVSKMLPLRYALRFQFLPRTRSQRKT